MEKFDWRKMYKVEEHIEQIANESVHDYVNMFYGVDSYEDLNEEQINSIAKFVNEQVNEYSIMYSAFQSLIDMWHDNQ